ncbi:MAG: S26 family signal peptidase [Flavobacteriales bacterium]|jgi:signal peptidase I|nr:S26 family signal peptidase [Flavobacteriales bacterium]
MIPYILLFAYLAVLLASLWKLFQKAGKPAWAAFVPVYNIIVWLKISGKPWWWVVLFAVPGVQLLMLVIMNVNISIVLGRRDFKEHVLMTFLLWWKVPETIFSKDAYVGPVPPAQRKRGLLGQWGDAILFAVIVATVFRTYTFEAFTIPTPSMEKSLLVGDYLFVSKLSYGPRLPMTPMTFPFTHHTMPLSASKPSFVDWFSMKYRRLPGFGTPQRGDAVVFNFPEGDTVVANFQNQSYYQLVRDHGREQVRSPDFRMLNMVDGRVRQVPAGGILVRPLDKRENYIKRCVAIADDTLEVRDGQVFVNGQADPLPAEGQMAYTFEVKEPFNERRLKEQFDISPDDVSTAQDGTVHIPLTDAAAARLKDFNNVVSMTRQNHIKGEPTYNTLPYFPNDPRYDWTEDNFGPIWIPKKGATVALDMDNLPLYRRIISLYEGNDLRVEGGTILINGQPATSYTFKQDYYWMMGDNRHRSQDSRFWGFVPHDHVVGKAVLVWFTKDPYTGIRWKRLFSKVR